MDLESRYGFGVPLEGYWILYSTWISPTRPTFVKHCATRVWRPTVNDRSCAYFMAVSS